MLLYNSTGLDISNALMSLNSGNSNNSAQSFIPIIAGANYSSDSTPVCRPYETSRTRIFFKRQAGDIPALSFYQNRMSGGSLYFEVSDSLA